MTVECIDINLIQVVESRNRFQVNLIVEWFVAARQQVVEHVVTPGNMPKI